MKPTAQRNALSGTSSTLVGIVLLAELAACASNPSAGDGASLVGTGEDGGAVIESSTWPPGVTLNTCDDYATVTVGSYVVESDFWNEGSCPGTQCMTINDATGAFSVTQFPNCGNTVASYPNVLYGCSFGTCSPGSVLPMPVSTLSTVTSSWDFSVGGVSADQYDVAYDIWFCQDDTCGPNGFPHGTELMIWLDYQNVKGWQYDLGPVSLDGHTWELWQATMGTGADAWTYLAYMIQAPMVSSVTNLDLNAFFRDAVSRGYIQNSWYLYAIQAGDELRTGGLPYDNNSFSVSINGVAPAIPDAGAETGEAASVSCDGGIPTAEGEMVVSDNYVTAGSLHGYAAAWTWVGSDSSAIACATPTCTAPDSLQVTAILQNGAAPLTPKAVSCSPGFAPSALCTAGTVTADPTYESVAGLGFNLSQETESDGGVDASSVDGITIGQSITITVEKSGALSGNSTLRVQLTDSNNDFYCYAGQWISGVAIPITQFNTQCWNNSGTFATSSTLFKRVDILVPSNASTDESFAYCLTNVAVK
jgi:cellulose 1,4-beta-cellobiosidase